MSSRTYRAWHAMRQRCDKSTHAQYADYGGRGITYDPRWKCFKVFLEDMGECPLGLRLTRRRVNDSYCKSNCSWGTASIGNRHKRTSRKNKTGVKGVSFHEKRQVWEARAQLEGVHYRLYYGPSFEMAVHLRKEWEKKVGL